MRTETKKLVRKVKPGELHYNWFDCSVGIDCVCGHGRDIVLIDEAKRCSGCGREYELRAYVVICES